MPGPLRSKTTTQPKKAATGLEYKLYPVQFEFSIVCYIERKKSGAGLFLHLFSFYIRFKQAIKANQVIFIACVLKMYISYFENEEEESSNKKNNTCNN